MKQTGTSRLTKYNKKNIKKKLPINLLKKAKREERNKNITFESKRAKKKYKKLDPIRLETETAVYETEMELKQILESEDLLSDIPYDCIPSELLGEIAMVNGTETTIYIERDGLSTLTIVLPKRNPTIADLKRAIESIARVQMKRELRERIEERKRRRCQNERNEIVNGTIIDNDQVNNENNDVDVDVEEQPNNFIKEHIMPQPACSTVEATANTTKTSTSTNNVSSRSVSTTNSQFLKPLKSTGELVYSKLRNGHHHRSNVSWKYLWRAFALFNVATNTPINDEIGSKLLADCDIENATTLKFCKREKYFGRKRQ